MSDHGRNVGVLVGLHPHPHAQIPGQRQQEIGHVEPALTLRVVGAGQVDELGKLIVLVIAQIGQRLDDARELGGERQFAERHMIGGQGAGAVGHHGLAQGVVAEKRAMNQIGG